MRKLLVSIALLGALICGVAFAQEVPSVDPLQALADLVLNFKSMSPIGIGMALIAILTQLTKVVPFFAGWKYTRFMVVALGQLYAIGYMVSTGSSWLNAAVMGLIASGGAVAIYEAFKGAKQAVTGSK